MKTVIEMAIEAELIYNEEGWCGWVEDTDLRPFIERFAELVRADERKKWEDQTAAELRRLHEANQEMREALKTCDNGTGWGDPYQRFDAKLVSAAIKKATKREQQ